MTDADLVLGRLDPAQELAGGVALDAGAAERAVGSLAAELGLSVAEAAEGIARVADAEMARAVRVMTVERGRDPRTMTLLAFGGAGPLHAAAIAEELAMERVVVPPTSGVLSALGLVVSERRRDLAESVVLAGAALRAEAIAETVARLASRGRAELGEPEAEVRAAYDLRYAGQAWELTVPGPAEPDPDGLRRSFEAAHEKRYGHTEPGAELELVTVRVAVAVAGGELSSDRREAAERPSRRARWGGERLETRIVEGIPEAIEGPAICRLPESTVAVPPGWRGGAAEDGSLVLERKRDEH